MGRSFTNERVLNPVRAGRLSQATALLGKELVRESVCFRDGTEVSLIRIS